MKTYLLFSVKFGVALALLMPLIVTEETLFPFIVGKAVYSRIVIEITFGLWLILAYYHQAYRLRRSWLLILFAVYVIVAFLSAVNGVSFQRSFWSTFERMQGVYDLLHWLAITLVIVSVFRNVSQMRVIFNCNLGISLFVAMMGLFEYYDVGIESYHNVKSIGRLGSTLGNSSYLGAYMLMNVFIALGLLGYSLKPKSAALSLSQRTRQRGIRIDSKYSWLLEWRLFWVTVVALDFYTLILTGTRGALAGLLLGVVVFAIAYVLVGRINLLKSIFIGFISLLFVGVVGFFSLQQTDLVKKIAESNSMVARLSLIGPNDPSLQGRTEAWEAGIRAFIDRPVFGWGPDNYLVAWGRYVSRDMSRTLHGDQAHNKFVEELTNTGVIGLLSYVAFWIFMAWVILRRVKDRETHEQILILFMGAAAIGYLTQNMFLFDTPGTMLQMILILSFVIVLESDDSRVIAELDTVGRNKQDSFYVNGKHRITVFRNGLLKLLIALQVRINEWNLFKRISIFKAFDLKKLSEYGVVAILIVGVSTLCFFNYKAYVASATLQKAFNPYYLPLDIRLSYFDEAVDLSPQWANMPRYILLLAMSSNWNSFTDDEKILALQKGVYEANRAVQIEPEAWWIYGSVVSIYQKAYELDPGYLELARVHLDKTIELAPEAQITRDITETQLDIEESHIGK